MIVQYYADSLGMARPGLVQLNERYIYLFQKWLERHYNEEVFVIDRARGAQTIDKLYTVFKEDEGYFTGTKDILIIHEGICDCAPRPIPLWFRRMVSVMPHPVKFRIIRFLHRHRAFLLKNGFSHYLVRKDKFEAILTEWLRKAEEHFDRMYIFTIAPTIPSIEQHSPGLGASIRAYNAILEKVVQQAGSNKLCLIDVHSLIEGTGDTESYILEDGHHINVKSHAMLAAQLIHHEQQYSSKGSRKNGL